MELEQDEAKPGAPEWMVTFADLMSLLLTFFVLLLSFSNTEIVKFRVMAGSVRNALGMKSEFDLSDVPTGNKLLPYEDPKEGEGGGPSSEEIEEQLHGVLEQLGLEEGSSARLTKHGVVLQLEGDLFFGSGAADLSPAALPVLDRLAEYIESVGRTVDIVGHTDNIPIKTQVYPSNWELSAARAGQAVRYLVEKGVSPDKVRAIGQADTVPIAENNTPAGRAINRRVEFIFTERTGAEESKTLDELMKGSGEASSE